jgi:hypothetical protein
MATTGIAPIKQALVRALRDSSALEAAVGGGKNITEGTEARGTDYPYVVYNVTASYRDWDWTNVTMEMDVDVWSISDQQVDAHNVDQLVAEALEDVELTTFLESSSGQTGLYCRRIGDMSLTDLDGAGNPVYRMGGAYRIWTDQSRTA